MNVPRFVYGDEGIVVPDLGGCAAGAPGGPNVDGLIEQIFGVNEQVRGRGQSD
jgi:hypothetical protein